LRGAERAEAAAKSAIDKLVADETAAIGQWAKSGDGPMPEPDLALRRQSGDALLAATATATAARSAIGTAEQVLADTGRDTEAGRQAVREAILDVMVEEAEPLFSELADAIARQDSALVRLIGLNQMLADHGNGAMQRDPDYGRRVLTVVGSLTDRRRHIENAARTSGDGPNSAAWAHLADRLGSDATAVLE
jgi:hypothetical protein